MPPVGGKADARAADIRGPGMVMFMGVAGVVRMARKVWALSPITSGRGARVESRKMTKEGLSSRNWPPLSRNSECPVKVYPGESLARYCPGGFEPSWFMHVYTDTCIKEEIVCGYLDFLFNVESECEKILPPEGRRGAA
jgi:hypothetical protein